MKITKKPDGWYWGKLGPFKSKELAVKAMFKNRQGAVADAKGGGKAPPFQKKGGGGKASPPAFLKKK